MREVNSNDNGFVTVPEIQVGECFRYRGEIWMRAVPAGYITNSSVLRKVTERGDAFAVNLKTGAFSAWRADAQVSPLNVLMDVRS